MGSCFEKKPLEYQTLSTLRKEKQPLNIFNRSILLSRNIARDIIPEEDSYIILGSRQSIEEDSICGSANDGTRTMLAEFQRRNPMGEEVPSCAYVSIRNLISGHWLHSHAVKTKKLLNEVCVCEDGQHEHDRWQLLAHHCNTIGDGDVLKVLNRHHKQRNHKVSSYPNSLHHVVELCC